MHPPVGCWTVTEAFTAAPAADCGEVIVQTAPATPSSSFHPEGYVSVNPPDCGEYAVPAEEDALRAVDDDEDDDTCSEEAEGFALLVFVLQAVTPNTRHAAAINAAARRF